MGCVGSDGEDELRTSPSVKKTVKFSEKFCDDSVMTVDYASVPRKLRSAVKKRCHESVSPCLLIRKKLNYVDEGIECPRKDGLKKFKASTKHGVSSRSLSEVVVSSITKDEEDVAETLFALAGMFPDKTAKNKTIVEDKLSNMKSTAAFLEQDSSVPTVEATPEKELGIKATDRDNVEAPNHSLEAAGGPVDECVNVQSTSEVSQLEKSLRRKVSTDLHQQGPELDISSTEINSNAERGIPRLPLNTVVPCNSSSRNKGPGGSNINQQELSLESGKKFESAFKSAAITEGQYELNTVSESKSNGSVLCPGLSLTESHNSDMQELSMKSFATNSLAVFPSTSCFLEPSDSENFVSMKKDPQVQVGSKKSWRRCSAHVLISHIIKDLQKAERANTLIVQSNQPIDREGLNRGALITSSSSKERSNSLNRISSMNNAICSAAERIFTAERNLTEVRNANLHKRLFQDQRHDSSKAAVCSASERNSSEVRNAILLHKRLLQDQQQVATTPGFFTLQKQNLDFFTILGRGSREETSLGAAKPDSSLVTMAQLHIPYLQSKNSQDLPVQLRGNFYSSTPFIDHRGAAASAQQVQLASYPGSSSHAPLVTGVTTLSKQAVWRQQHQNWSNRLIAHQKPRQDAAATNTRNWQNEVQDGAYLVHHAQSLFPPSHSSTELLSSNYGPQQQQQFISISPSLPPSKVQGQHRLMTYEYQGIEGARPPESLFRI